VRRLLRRRYWHRLLLRLRLLLQLWRQSLWLLTLPQARLLALVRALLVLPFKVETSGKVLSEVLLAGLLVGQSVLALKT
jgi:hypothetical protein